MAWRVEGTDIVIDGFENGIAPSPYQGIADMRNMNIISIPNEATVNFSSTKISLASITGTVTSADAGADTISYTGTQPTNQMAIVFAGGSLPGGINAGTQSLTADTNVYWVINSGATTFQIASSPGSSTPVDITSSGTGTYATIDIGIPMHGANDVRTGTYYVLDSNSRVWYSTGSFFVFMGNLTRTNSNANGLVFYQGSNGSGALGTGYLFVFRDARIDYTSTSAISWVPGWNPATGGSGADSMVTAAGTANSHHALVGQDNAVYYCDSNAVGSFFEKTGQAFDPATPATFTYSQRALTLPFIEKATWLAELGKNLMVMGQKNFLYPWDKVSIIYNYPLMLAENAAAGTSTGNLPKMVTLNTNVFIFTGNRGRIYVTNGSQVELFAKLPDSVSGTVEPYFTWGGVGFNKNQLYFGVSATTNSAVAINQYGGLWAIDVDTKAIRLVNQLSYATYAGSATMFIPVFGVTSGTGFYVGWNSGASTYGIDISSSNLYTNYESYIDTDMIPVGTFFKKRTLKQIEYKLTSPLVSGEGIKISYRTDLSQSFTQIFEDTTVGNISFPSPVNFQQAQWVQFRINTKSTNSSPSYTRLREIRIR